MRADQRFSTYLITFLLANKVLWISKSIVIIITEEATHVDFLSFFFLLFLLWWSSIFLGGFFSSLLWFLCFLFALLFSLCFIIGLLFFSWGCGADNWSGCMISCSSWWIWVVSWNTLSWFWLNSSTDLIRDCWFRFEVLFWMIITLLNYYSYNCFVTFT